MDTPLIWKLWDTAWSICNYKNHTFHSTDGITKTEVLIIINKIITYQLNRVTTCLKHIYQFIFHITIHTLLFSPVLQHLSWISPMSSVGICAHWIATSKMHLYADEILLDKTTRGRLIPALTKFDEDLPLRTTI